MSYKKPVFYSFLITVLWFTSCKHKSSKSLDKKNPNIQYATHFNIDKHNKYSIIQIKEPWAEAGKFIYVAGKNKEHLPDSLKKYPFIKVPVEKIVVTSTTHLPHLALLGKEDKLIGFPNTKYISSDVFRKKIENGQIKEIGNGARLNIEETLLLKPDLIMAFSSGNDQNQFEIFKKNGIPVIFNADWMEKDPLGRAEWIKLFGVLFDKEKKAFSIFDQIAFNYNLIKSKIKNKQNKPKVFQGGFFGDKWYLPGGKSYAAKLIEDAGGEYIWKNDSHTGSVSYSFENVLIELPKADIWLNPGSIVSKSTLIEQIPQAKNFRSFQKDKIYTYALAKGKKGGLIYFEDSPAHPDKVLEDLYHIFYPEDTPQYKFKYYSILLP
jgi:iron complex transport system substrate-binding protein